MNSEVFDIWTKEPFIKKEGLNGYATHQPCLHWCLNKTGGNVIELGSGETSTGFISKLCSDSRTFISLETNGLFYLSNKDKEWIKFVKVASITEIESILKNNTFGVVFIDHAPGEHRQTCIEIVKNSSDYVVVHDTEEAGYGYDFSMYKYKYTFEYYRPFTTILSNKYEIDFK